MKAERVIYGGIEGGGTKFVCAVGTCPNDILCTTTIPTTTPDDTLAAVADFFLNQLLSGVDIEAIGVGSFGPLTLRKESPYYGRINAKAKPDWLGVDIAAQIVQRIGVRVVLDTDVNCALLGEARWGAGRGFRDLAYLTVGTGIGGGLMVQGQVAYGFAHPEMGHMLIGKLPEDRGFPGVCHYHGDRCLEGLASGPALMARSAGALATLRQDDPIWSVEGSYLATACLNILLLAAPRRIILGGGVMRQQQLLPMVRSELRRQLAGYLDFQAAEIDLEELVVGASLGDRAGITGAIERVKEWR